MVWLFRACMVLAILVGVVVMVAWWRTRES